jgi:hypothetical protein
MSSQNNVEYICINYLSKPKYYIPRDGVGDCSKCLPDEEKNKLCKLYYPIPIRKFEDTEES